MKIEPLSQKSSAVWDGLCLRSFDAWLWHTRHWLRYQLAYRPALASQDKSFLVYDQNGDVLALCPLFLENHGDHLEFSFGGSHLPPPALDDGLTSKRREEVLSVVFENIDGLASKYGVARCSFRVSPLTPAPFNYLMKHGYLDVSLNSQVIDTSLPLEALKKGLRKGHASDVKRSKERLSTFAFEGDSCTDEIFAGYQDMHRQASGRVTRSQSTFDTMKSMIREGLAVLFAAQKDGAYIGFSLVGTYKRKAYYMSGANAPSVGNMPIAHAMQWNALEWLHERGYLSYEIGWQEFGPQLHSCPSDKEIQVAHFKRGFGGRTTPIFMGEKYYDRAFFVKVLSDRTDRCAEAAFRTTLTDRS